MAGTANDYIGTLSTTRSGRTCAKWLSDYDLEQMRRRNASSSSTTRASSGTPKTIRAISRRKHSSPERDVSPGPSPRTPLVKSSSKQPSPKLLEAEPAEAEFKAIKPVHRVDRAYWNDSLYPERSVRNASNYCRDPSRNIAGTWCYTMDPLVPQDLCDVRDCEKPGKA